MTTKSCKRTNSKCKSFDAIRHVDFQKDLQINRKYEPIVRLLIFAEMNTHLPQRKLIIYTYINHILNVL